jgi:Kef-type K+ transport system membrane component KefB
VLNLFSPLMFFSVCLGAGATGLLMKHLHLPMIAVAAASIVGGAAFYHFVIKTLWNTVFKFASTPSAALEGAVAGEAEALSRFDASGKGLVRLCIDNQLVSILATLEASDRPTASEIVPGEKLLVTSVDGHTNTCRVTRL